MNIIGLDSLAFGVDDVDLCVQYLTDYGLTPLGTTAAGGTFEALDGTSVTLQHKDDATLPPPMGPGCLLRKTTYGVADAAALSAVEAELRKDRNVQILADGSVESVDDMGFAIGFRKTVDGPWCCPAARQCPRGAGTAAAQ